MATRTDRAIRPATRAAIRWSLVAGYLLLALYLAYRILDGHAAMIAAEGRPDSQPQAASFEFYVMAGVAIALWSLATLIMLVAWFATRPARSSPATDMPEAWARVDAMVTDPAQRSELSHDGWWAATIVDAFAFLTDYGIELEDISFHQKDHSVEYLGRCNALTFAYQEEDELCWAAISDFRSRDGGWALDDLIVKREPSMVAPSLEPFSMATVQRRIRFWAAGLERIAPTFFPGPDEARDCPPGDTVILVGTPEQRAAWLREYLEHEDEILGVDADAQALWVPPADGIVRRRRRKRHARCGGSLQENGRGAGRTPP